MKTTLRRRTKVSESVATKRETPLAREQRAFQQQLPQLLRRYAGQYVAFQGGRVVASDRDDEALAARMFARVGDALFYIARVEKTPSVYEIPSPELLN